MILKMRPPGLEPGSPTWKVRIIPLDHGRFINNNEISKTYDFLSNAYLIYT